MATIVFLLSRISILTRNIDMEMVVHGTIKLFPGRPVILQGATKIAATVIC